MTERPFLSAIDAEYFDGVTPVPVRGILRIDPAALSFAPRGGSAAEAGVFGYGDVAHISKLNGQTRVTFRGAGPASANRLVTFINSDAHRSLVSLLAGSGTGTLARLGAFVKYGPAGKKIALVLSLLPALALLVYAGLFESYRLVPRSVDDRLGKLIVGRLTQEFKPRGSRKLEAVLERIKKRLVPKDSGRSYTILLLEHPLPNAFALPDGHIILLTGLVDISNSPEEIAGVMAHEISHVERRHGIRQLVRLLGASYLLHMMIGAGFEELEMAETASEISGLLIFLKYSRQFEREADEDGARYLHRSRISCRGLIGLYNRLSAAHEQRPAVQWLDTHPDMKERIARLSAEAEKERFRARPILKRGEKWSRIKKY